MYAHVAELRATNFGRVISVWNGTVYYQPCLCIKRPETLDANFSIPPELKIRTGKIGNNIPHGNGRLLGFDCQVSFLGSGMIALFQLFSRCREACCRDFADLESNGISAPWNISEGRDVGGSQRKVGDMISSVEWEHRHSTSAIPVVVFRKCDIYAAKCLPTDVIHQKHKHVMQTVHFVLPKYANIAVKL